MRRAFQMSPVMVLANEPEWPPTWLENSGARPEPVRLGGAAESVDAADVVAMEVEADDLGSALATGETQQQHGAVA